MANKPWKYCAHHRCPNLVPVGVTYCDEHKAPVVVKKTDHFYSTARWQRYRRWYRNQHPLCEQCLAEGRTKPMAVVDHIVPIKDGGARFDPSNTQSLCHACHNRKTAEERGENGPKVYAYAKNHRQPEPSHRPGSLSES